jgi:rhomboid protease GluP
VADGETLRFARAVLNRPYKFTIALLIANLFIFLLMWQSSGLTSAALWEIPLPVLLAYGAKLNFLINEHHQWWRFVTPMFVHVNLPHLLVNMYSLWIVGPYVEKLYGSAKFVVFWVLTGVAGVVASYLTVRPGSVVSPIGRFIFKQGDVPSAGASGALFGLVGVLFVFGIKFRHELPEGFKRAFGTGMLPIILINLFIGYLGRGFIDNAAHLGGLVSGAMLALVVNYRRPGERSGIAVTWRVLQIAAIALVVVCFLKTVQQFNKDQLRHEQTVKFVSYAKAITDAQEAFDPIAEHDVTRGEAALKALESVPPLDPKADELKERLKTLLLRAKALNAPAESSAKSAPKNPQQQADLTKDFLAWSKEYNAWLKTTGRNYGSD